jgi:ABC-type proline/glycine betaine transport system ATPase subunit
VLVGPSGCGKTTAMRMVNRMIDITGGDILLDGASVKDRRPAELRREIGYAIQQIGLFPHLTVGENIATVPRLLGWDKTRIRARIDELLELVSLDAHETRDRYPAQLSGGQRQRVGVARALAVDPPLMLMDEPFGAIDPINRERLQNEFLRLQREIRKTVVFVTHDIDEAIKMGDRIAVLQKGGKLAQYASPAELLMYPANPFVEDFVGADRALKRLALQRVRDVDLWKAPLVRVGTALEPTPFVSSNEVAVTQETADKLGLQKISDLEGKSQDLTLYGTPECRQRLDCLLGLQEVYGLDFKKFVPVDIALRHEALTKGQADVSIVFTTDPQNKREGFVLLEDDKGMFPPYNSTLVVRDDVIEEAGPDLEETVTLVNEGLTDEVMQELNARVDLDKETPEAVAGQYLEESGLTGS